MSEKRIRICDIAEELGLSTATVSNVLNGKTKKISDETVKRVQAALEERQYIPSMAGILLAQNSSRIIGVVVNDHEKYEGHVLEDVFIASSLNQLSEEIEKNGLFMMVKRTKESEAIIKFASMWNMEGLVLIGFCEQDYTYLRSHMRIPFVVYDGFYDHAERICNITIDNYDGGFQVGTYLKENGHSRAIFLADNDTCMDWERFEGFCAAFGKEQVQFWLCPMEKEKRHLFYEEHLEELKNIHAVFAASDYYAIDFMQFLAEKGIQVPEELSVVGFDDIPLCRMVSPALTSVRQDVKLRAQIALEKLRELKEQKMTDTYVKLPVQLIVRESTCNRKKETVGL